MHLPATLLALPLFSTADATRHGVGSPLLRRAVTAGELRRVRRGWYAPAGAAPDPDRAYAARCTSAAREHGLPLTGLSALVAHGLPTWDLDDEPVHLAGPAARTRGDVRVHLPLPDTEPATGVVPVLDAVLAAALHDPERALAAADAAVRAGRLDRDTLVTSLGRLDGRAGARAAREALSLVDGRREAVSESRVALACHRWGIPLVPQHRIDLGVWTARGDFLVQGTGVLLEVDGRTKYTDGDALFREKRREDAIRARGYTVVRIVWADLYRLDELRVRILDAVELDRRIRRS